jgi:CheY-like chemotaxis protein
LHFERAAANIAPWKEFRALAVMRKIILLAEDSPDDVLIFQVAFRRAVLPYDIYVVRDGQQAIEYLAGDGNYSDRGRFPFPDLLILDLKMPIKSGFDVLQWLRSHADFGKLRVVILSSSDDQRDARRAADLGAGTFFMKSPRLHDVMQHLSVLWPALAL